MRVESGIRPATATETVTCTCTLVRNKLHRYKINIYGFKLFGVVCCVELRGERLRLPALSHLEKSKVLFWAL